MSIKAQQKLLESIENGSLQFPMIFVDDKGRDSEILEISAVSDIVKNKGIPTEITLIQHVLQSNESFQHTYKLVKNE